MSLDRSDQGDEHRRVWPRRVGIRDSLRLSTGRRRAESCCARREDLGRVRASMRPARQGVAIRRRSVRESRRTLGGVVPRPESSIGRRQQCDRCFLDFSRSSRSSVESFVRIGHSNWLVRFVQFYEIDPTSFLSHPRVHWPGITEPSGLRICAWRKVLSGSG